MVLSVLALCLALPGMAAGAEPVADDRLQVLVESLKPLEKLSRSVPENLRKNLSGATLNLFFLAEHSEVIESLFRERVGTGFLPDESPRKPLPSAAAPAAGSVAGSRTFQVSDPARDLVRSRLYGFTQVETSTAWCGSNVVVGFFDTGGFHDSYNASEDGVSLLGVARSEDSGQTFAHLGYLNPGPKIKAGYYGTVISSPTVQCSDAQTFYYGHVYKAATAEESWTMDVAVSKSTDGGKTWANPVSVVKTELNQHILEHPWLAVDATQSGRVYAVYAHFDISGKAAGCPTGATRAAIELVKSTDGGATWSTPPVTIAEICPDDYSAAILRAPQAAVGPAGEVYAVWEAFPDDGSSPQILLGASTDGGSTFGAPVKVADVTPVGASGMFQGALRSNEYPSLAVDGRAGSKNVYVAWGDGRNFSTKDTYGMGKLYRYADILFTRSTDGGATWLASPVRVNQNVEPNAAKRGSDQFFPALAVDKDGGVGICYYDRRADPYNFRIQRYCALSTTAGDTWSELKVTTYGYLPLHTQDALIDPMAIGEYDTLAVDRLQQHTGFIGAYADSNAQANMDVRAAVFSF
jgi:hypothetical protein